MTHGYDPTLTPLQIVEKAAAYLLSLKTRCVDEEGYYAYRGLNGSACAVGHVISDELAKKVERKTLRTPQLFASEIPDEAIPFLLGLQMNHDAWFRPTLEKNVEKILERARAELS